MRILTLLAALALSAAGCAGPAPAAPPAAGPAPSPTGSVVSAVVPDALRFAGTTLDGKPFDAAPLAGRPVVLWFWAPWCATCLGQAPAVADLAKQYGERIATIGVAGMDKSTTAMHQFVTEGEVGNVTHLDDQAGAVWRKFGITQQSVFVMIDRHGKVMQNGYQDTVTLGEWFAYLDGH
jgi:thiol-disulfide isomerase/thioredoxin